MKTISLFCNLSILGFTLAVVGCMHTKTGSASDVASSKSTTTADLCYAVSHDVDAATDSDENFQDDCTKAVKDAGLTRKADITDFVCGKAETFNFDYSEQPSAKLKAKLRKDCLDTAAGSAAKKTAPAASVKKATDSLCYDVSHYVDAATDSDEDGQDACTKDVAGQSFKNLQDAVSFICANVKSYNFDLQNSKSAKKLADVQGYCQTQASKLK